MATNEAWDLFISYAAEDRDEVALPVAEMLSVLGLRVWLDEFELRIGDSLTERIDHGLSRSRFGVVVLSPNFFSKSWPRRELAGLTTRELQDKRIVILPVWHNVTKEEVAGFSLPLADKLAARTSDGVGRVAVQIASRFSQVTLGEHIAPQLHAMNPGAELRFEPIRLDLFNQDGNYCEPPYILAPNELARLSITVKNTGLRTWLSFQPSREGWTQFLCGPVRLGTASQRDHASIVFDAVGQSWISVNRPADVFPDRIERGQAGTFTFAAVIPDVPGDYIERYSVVCEWYSWFSGPEIEFSFSVA